MKKTITLLSLCFAAVLFADNTTAAKVYETGYKAYQNGQYYKAATIFEEAFILADSPTIRANCLRAQIGAWRMCEMPYREFKAIESLLAKYPEFANFKELVAREYEIGTSYYNGTREPAYWHLRWIPWLTDDNKCAEIFGKALKRAPFAPEAPAARLRLAHLLDEEGKLRSSLEQYRLIIKDYPDSREYRYALLALANGLIILSERGDGDGKHIAEAHDVLKTFAEKFPKAPEMSWVKRQLMRYNDLQGKRYYEMARYYEKSGRPDAARRYLAIVLRDYPESLAAQDSEKLLVKLDKSFVPGDFVQPSGSRLPSLRTYEIPHEAGRVLITPGHNNHYLVPVPDYSTGKKEEE